MKVVAIFFVCVQDSYILNNKMTMALTEIIMKTCLLYSFLLGHLLQSSANLSNNGIALLMTLGDPGHVPINTPLGLIQTISPLTAPSLIP